MMARPAKEEYYLNIAQVVSQRSTCLKVLIGAIIVKEDQIIAAGYVGAPRHTRSSLGHGFCLRRKLHQALRSVTRDYERFEFNTIISSLMELSNEMSRLKDKVYGHPAWDEAVEKYTQMLAPVTPHIAEEIWQYIGKPYSVHTSQWPAVDEAAAAVEEITLVIQVNGKVRDRINVPSDINEEYARSQALSSEAVQKLLEGREPRQVVYVRGRLVNIVI